jgi:secondary thiamine-phosphate synthase enzyme
MMKNFFHTIQLSTHAGVEFHDVTIHVLQAVKKSKLADGMVLVFTPHTTCSIKLNENEKNLVQDMTAFLEQRAPTKGKYGHDVDPIDGRKNAHSHLKSLILNSSETIPLRNGELLLGGWQKIFFVELDGPREKREIVVQILGE